MRDHSSVASVYISSTAVEMPVEFQRDPANLLSYLAASSFRKFWW